LFIISFLLGLYIPILYKQSRMLYFKTDEYKQTVIKYGNMDLKRYSIKQIKWLKKLGYISKVTYLYYKKPNKK
jgi:competence protein ComGC